MIIVLLFIVNTRIIFYLFHNNQIIVPQKMTCETIEVYSSVKLIQNNQTVNEYGESLKYLKVFDFKSATVNETFECVQSALIVRFGRHCKNRPKRKQGKLYVAFSTTNS